MRLGVRLADQAERVVDQASDRPEKLRRALREALRQGLEEVAGHAKARYFRGFRPGRAGDGTLQVRSGALRQAIRSGMDRGGRIAGFVGVTQGPAAAYAATQLGTRRTTIRPKSARHLWIPIADNVGPGGRVRMSPREAIATGDLRTFRSKRGNLVAVLQGAGNRKGKLLFALKDQVTVKGSGAILRAAEDRTPRLRQLLTDAIEKGLRDAT